MTAPLIASLAPVKLNSTVLAAAEVRIASNIVRAQFAHSGNLFPSVIAVAGAMPRVSFKTPLKDALALIGTSLLALTTFEVYLAKFSASTYTKLGAGNHTKWASSTGCAYIAGWSVNQAGIAMADVEVIPFSADGIAHPLTRTDSVSLPTLGSEPLLHTNGPWSFNGTVITGINSSAVTFNHSVDVRVSDGDLYPRTAALIEGMPSMGGEHLDPLTLQTTLGWSGVNISSNVVAYWKSYDATTQLVSTANSVSLTIALGRCEISESPTSQGTTSKATIVTTALSSSSTHPFATSTAATAPAT